MSKPFTLTIVNGTSGRLKPAKAEETPKANNTSTYQDKLRARAALISTYASVLGVEVSQGDLAEALARRLTPDSSEQDEAQAITTLLRRHGMTAEMVRSQSVEGQAYPALVFMTSGQLLLVMGHEGDDLVVFDKTCTDNCTLVPASDFIPFF